MTKASTPEAVVQAQLDAYNAHDVDALIAIYADDAQQFQHPATLLAQGSAQIRARFASRFAAARPHARLVKRIAVGDMVIDHEIVSSAAAEGPGSVELVAMYQVQDGRIAKAWFIFGAKTQLRLAQAADIANMEALIARSGIELSAGFYTEAQAAAVTEHVFGVDTQLVADQTYFLIERGGVLWLEQARHAVRQRPRQDRPRSAARSGHASGPHPCLFRRAVDGAPGTGTHTDAALPAAGRDSGFHDDGIGRDHARRAFISGWRFRRGRAVRDHAARRHTGAAGAHAQSYFILIKLFVASRCGCVRRLFS